VVNCPAQERQVDPTFLYRHIPAIEPKAADVTTPACGYKPVFGAGDPVAGIVRGVARFGEITVAPGGACKPVSYAAEEQVYVILEGAGVLDYAGEQAPVKKNDFLYLPPGVRHSLSNSSPQACRAMVMGFKIPTGTNPTVPPKLLIANIDEVKKQPLASHPPSVLYQLLMGDVKSTRDRIPAGQVLTSLYVMEFAPGGTNFPHHHDSEEEIYVLLDGRGEMVAGGGVDGIEGRRPARAGDAYFFRLNCTVGFYADKEPARILAVRSLYPFRRR
jgi:mannose-6-phosphate isomerase-like protein (cupin superfamily)